MILRLRLGMYSMSSAADPQLTALIIVEYEEECQIGSARALKFTT